MVAHPFFRQGGYPVSLELPRPRRAADSRPSLDDLHPKRVSRNDGDQYDFLSRHQAEAVLVSHFGRRAMQKVAPYLCHRISDERTLAVAWDYLAEHGGPTPGPDGLRYDDLNPSERWQLLRSLRDAIRSGEYQPGEERVCRISKGPGRGTRPLVIQNIEDRVVQRAAVEIVQPLVDPRFLPHSFGFRPRRGALDALAHAEWYYLHDERQVWVTDDIRDAFLRVPLARLANVVRKYLIDDQLVEFIMRLLDGASTPGLRQGGSLSPLLLNLYLHHSLDVPWRQRHPDLPLLRYADDLLLLCRTAAEAEGAYDELARLLTSVGMPPKGTRESAVRKLSTGSPVEWMGFRITGTRHRLCLRLTENSMDGLAEGLWLAHDAPDAPLRAIEVIKGWVAAKGPCYKDVDHEETYGRIQAIAHERAFDEILSQPDLKESWQRAYARWGKLRAAHHAALLGGSSSSPGCHPPPGTACRCRPSAAPGAPPS